MSAVENNLDVIKNAFCIPGKLLGTEVLKRGHIHDTYVSRWQDGSIVSRYIHQMINRNIFKSPEKLMSNISVVLNQLTENPLAGMIPLEIIPSTTKKSFAIDEAGEYWRTYRYIEDSYSVDLCDSTKDADNAAFAFAAFQKQLSSISINLLSDVLPGYFDIPGRFSAFEKAVKADIASRVKLVSSEIDFGYNNRGMVKIIPELMESGKIPTRIVHGDTKINNILFAQKTGKAICVIDLDTCMPAYGLYDFGDLVRTSTSSSSEDEKDFSKIKINLELFENLVTGYLRGIGEFWNKEEKELMVFAGKLITFSLFLRFLTDFLNGDTYFKVHHPDQNLDRSRAQLQLVRVFTANETEMLKILHKYI